MMILASRELYLIPLAEFSSPFNQFDLFFSLGGISMTKVQQSGLIQTSISKF